ncbi:MAG: hypothetical protein EBZ75_14445, partial [Oxalobacteraceae bacterium]|nr:hypothetical protein [Oxalobacteraceae bacterium]
FNSISSATYFSATSTAPTILGTVTDYNAATGLLTIKADASVTAAPGSAVGNVLLFSGLATQELNDPSTGATSTDRTLGEAIYNAALVNSDPQTATAAFQIVQRTANNFVLELGKQRANLGAAMNQMDYTLQNITDLASNLEQARSRVIDTDYASETAALTRGQILQQAATAMLAQANQMPNVILTLLK